MSAEARRTAARPPPRACTRSAGGASGRPPTARPATRSCRTSCCTGSPPRASRRRSSWSYSFWLGTVSAALLFLLVLSGLPLLFLYIPSVERAYASVKDIEYVITFGSWIRAVHRISAHLMVAAVFLHLVRVFLTGAYKNGVGQGQKREWNWVIGVAMLLLTLFLSFTGYLLPWDQLAYWAVTVGTNIASSVPFVGPDGPRAPDRRALDRAGDAHPLLRPPRPLPADADRRPLRLPHVARPQGRRARASRRRAASRNRRSTPPAARSKTYTLLGIARGTSPQVRASTLEAPDTTVNSVPDLTRRIAIVILGTIALVGILSVFVRSPLEEPANALITPNPAKAPWYFLWLQEIVTDTTVHIGSFTINGAFLGGVLLPGALARPDDRLAVARPEPRRRGGRLVRDEPPPAEPRVPRFSCAAVLALTVIGTFLRGPYWHFYWPWQPWPELPSRI